MNARQCRSDPQGDKKKQVATVSAFLTMGSCRRQKPTVGTKPTVGKAPTVATSVAIGARGARRAAAGTAFTLIELIAAMTILLLLTAVALPVARVQVQARARGRT